MTKYVLFLIVLFNNSFCFSIYTPSTRPTDLSSYEPCNYPGVNIKYYLNPLRNNFGICDCEKPCNGKGLNDTCKKITIAVFKSGKIIITGGRNKNHIQKAYEFITEFIEENKTLVLKKD